MICTPLRMTLNASQMLPLGSSVVVPVKTDAVSESDGSFKQCPDGKAGGDERYDQRYTATVEVVTNLI